MSGKSTAVEVGLALARRHLLIKWRIARGVRGTARRRGRAAFFERMVEKEVTPAQSLQLELNLLGLSPLGLTPPSPQGGQAYVTWTAPSWASSAHPSAPGGFECGLLQSRIMSHLGFLITLPPTPQPSICLLMFPSPFPGHLRVTAHNRYNLGGNCITARASPSTPGPPPLSFKVARPSPPAG